jgi:hypothetical protein
MSLVTNPFQACNDIFFKPSDVFNTIKNTHNWSWLPAALVLVMSALPVYMYMNFVDFEWFKELIIEAQYSEVSPSEQEQIRNGMTQGAVLWMQIISSVIGIIVWNAVLATYFNMTTKFDENNLQGFTDWYGFVWWMEMPIIFGGVISMLILSFASDHQLPLSDLFVTSLSFPLGLEMTSEWFGVASSISLLSLWTIYLAKVGISCWVNTTEQKAWVLAVIPNLALWLIMSAFAMF